MCIMTETLENRRLMSGTIVLMPQGVLQITGTAGNDTAVVVDKGATIQVTLKQGATQTKVLPKSLVQRIMFRGLDGNDVFINNTAISSAAFGGNGNDLLVGGSNSDILIGDAGEDRLYGRGGNDYMIGGTGRDWLYGGDGADFLTGGNDSARDYLFGQGGNDHFQVFAFDVAIQ